MRRSGQLSERPQLLWLAPGWRIVGSRLATEPEVLFAVADEDAAFICDRQEGWTAGDPCNALLLAGDTEHDLVHTSGERGFAWELRRARQVTIATLASYESAGPVLRGRRSRSPSGEIVYVEVREPRRWGPVLAAVGTGAAAGVAGLLGGLVVSRT